MISVYRKALLQCVDIFCLGVALAISGLMTIEPDLEVFKDYTGASLFTIFFYILFLYILVPRDAAEKILQLDFDGEVRIKRDSNSAAFVTENYMVKTRLIEGPYMQYSMVFVDMPVHVTVNRKNLMDAANRAAMCIDAGNRIPIRFQFDGDNVRVYLEARNAKYSETVPLEKEAEEPVLIAFDPRLLMETLKAFDTEKVHMRMSGGTQPLLMDADGRELRSLVLPVSI